MGLLYGATTLFLPSFKDRFALFFESPLPLFQIFAVKGLQPELFNFPNILRVQSLIFEATIKDQLHPLQG